ncbi:hypothetical protein PSTT_17129 [Puccinia striiformis]|uniref:Uncharacterized protein n=1 Tax=Puccinia striiformis TaxID=27350 RepID=A0A2S4U9G0_9BASI|nr:hypothetical protein PSTT_17129 [Puccinia striiformis]
MKFSPKSISNGARTIKALNLSLLSILLDQGFISSLTRGTTKAPDPGRTTRLRAAKLVRPSLRVYRIGTFDSLLSQQLTLGEICVVRSIDGQFLWRLGKHSTFDNQQSIEVICRVSS